MVSMRRWKEGLSFFDAKQHSQKLKQAKWGEYRRLWDIQWMNGYLMVVVNEVHFGKYEPTHQAGREILNVRNWV